MKKNKYVMLRTRVPHEVAEALNAMASANYPRYRVLRDVLINALNGAPLTCRLSYDTVRELGAVADVAGYRDVGELLANLSAAFLRVYRYNRGLLCDDEPTPDEEIREMFAELDISNKKKIDAERMVTRKGT